MSWPSFVQPVALSLQITLTASIIAFVLGLLAAWRMSRSRFPGKALLETMLLLPLVLPPTVIGFGLLLVFGRRSWIGRFFEWWTGQPIVFTWGAAVIAAVVVAFPLVYQTAKASMSSIDRDLLDAGRSFGAGEWQLLRYVILPLSARFLVSGYVLGFARGIGEFGATLMFAGNIPGRTQTIPMAIYLAVESGRYSVAVYWTLTTVAISFILLWLAGGRSRH